MARSYDLRRDLSICADCIREFTDVDDRRHRFPFIQCGDCGPSFALGPTKEEPSCQACLAEFRNSTGRRFGFSKIACPDCGPVLRLVSHAGLAEGETALTRAASLLHEGGIVVVKATAGFHLAVDACNEEAVRRLRTRKQRPHKPFAVMARDLEWVERVAYLGAEERALLLGPERPILLLPRRGEALAPSVAPGLSDLGLFLPSSALQLLLMEAGPPLQVMTSANLSGAPTARDDDEALRILQQVGDALLHFNRPIENHADDSVFRASARGAIPIRRSRALVPRAILLPFEAPPLLAVGGQEKNTVCVAEGRRAFLSQHIGDLEGEAAWARFVEDIERLKEFAGIEPAAVAHDLHPDYRSTRYALECGLPRVAVQHHHAHAAALLAEHGWRSDEPAMAVVFDGTGLGDDQGLWGGEFLLANFDGYQRLGHLRPLALPGGSAAIRNPWRLALAALIDAELPPEAFFPESSRSASILAERLRRGDDFPRSSGAGRWFDAASALLGVRLQVSYDGQAPAELESIASKDPVDPYPFDLRFDQIFQIDLRPTVRALAADLSEGGSPALLAARFHETMARAIETGCLHLRASSGASAVALGGGCFQNRLLLERATARLEAIGLRVLSAREVPQNDGGLSLGQAAIAARRLAREIAASSKR